MELSYNCQYISYRSTNRFSKIALDYITKDQRLRSFYEHDTDLQGVRNAIAERRKRPVNRQLLFDELTKQYEGTEITQAVRDNIQRLLDEDTFTVCSAHQPNIFTGHLYFVYKIMHSIKLAASLSEQIPECKFVPVFFVGSEDADLEELNHIELDGKKYTWETKQTGAVGKMFVDKDLLKLIGDIEGRLLAEPYGREIVSLLRECYVLNSNIERATFLFVHHLFKQFGLVVFLPDSPTLKNEMIGVFQEDIFKNNTEKIVRETSARLARHHHAQAFARDINLFYMKDNIRQRIVKAGDRFVVHQTDISFTQGEMLQELREHPGRFSPNVILRGVFQERMLPGIIFIGGGGELAYWLQLKDVFGYFNTPYPMLLLRNSFLIIEKKWQAIIEKLSLTTEDLFDPYEQLLQMVIKRNSKYNLSLSEEKALIDTLYSKLALRAGTIDKTLVDHIKNLQAKQQKKLTDVEKKFMSSEKKNNEATDRQISRLLHHLFPNGGLQERTENFMLLYAKWGAVFFDAVYKTSPALSPSFCVISEK